MDQDVETIIENCNNGDYSRAPEEDFTDCCDNRNKVYKVQGEDRCLFYWNSSNQQAVRHSTALERFAELLEEDEDCDGGTVDDGWNEIMFEIK
jgi:hypothetical protein